MLANDSQTLGPDDLAIIAEEEQILSKVLAGLRVARGKSRLNLHDIGQRLLELREQAGYATNSDLPALFDQMNTQRALIESTHIEELPDARAPYFAHMQLSTGGKLRDILIGHQTFLDVSDAPINDWRNGPIASVFFNYRQGEPYEQELPGGRVATGIIVKRYVLTIRNGILEYIGTPKRSYIRQDGAWRIETRNTAVTLSGGAGQAQRTLGTGGSNRLSPDIAGLLDTEQYRILSTHEDDPLVILGHAGSGKTTVALHRLALLNFRNRQRFRQERLCVVVPDKGLVRLSRKLLDGLSLTKISVISSDNFVESRLRRVAKNVPQRVNRDYSWDIAKFKRHEAWLKVLPKFIELQAAEVQRILVSKYHYAESSAELATQLDSDPLLVRLEKAYAAERKLQSSAVHRSHQIDDGYHRVKRRLLNASQDLADLFTNEDILAEVVKASSGELTMEQATICFRRSKLQSDSAPSSHYKDIDEDRLQTVDGGHLTDDATSDDLNNTMDIDDAPLLMLLRRMKRGLRRGQAEGLHLYEHIVVDEAQDLSALELQCIGAALDANGTVTVAGDSVQQINNTSSFSSWQSVARNLDVSAPLVNQLETSYRSPAPIAAFAHAVLGPLAPPKAPRTIRDGMPIHYDHMPNEGHLIIKLIDVLRDLTSKEPNASIAVVCKSPETATRFYKLLVDLPRIRLVFDGEFEFLPGVDVTTVFEIKGLEFDYVIMPDVHAAAYPDTLDARRQLHVAATRAIHQLWIISVGLASPLLAALKTEPI